MLIALDATHLRRDKDMQQPDSPKNVHVITPDITTSKKIKFQTTIK